MVDVMEIDIDRPEKVVYVVGLGPGEPFYMTQQAANTLEAAFAAFCTRHSLAAQAVTAAASIDLKQNEPGLLAFCQARGWPVRFYSAAQLRSLPGQFTPSPFVQRVTGVDNVCERAAVLDADGSLFYPKFACSGVTLALACRPFAPDWRWQNG